MEGDWWRKWIETGNSSLYENRTSDVLCANCISNQDPLACLRSGVVALLGLVTAFYALTRIIRLHSTHPSHIRLLLYFILLVHCIAGSFEWLLGWNTQLALVILYAKAVELVIICYFYLDVASNMMHWSSAAGRRLCFSALFLMFTYFTLFLVMGLLLSMEPWTDCHAPYWIWFSAGEFVTVQLMVGSFYLILRRMSRISASNTIRRNQKYDLISLFWVFETSVLADLCYHIGMFILADDHKGCSGVFNHDQVRYSLLKAPYDLFSFLLPVWAILYVFRPSGKRQNLEMDTEEFLSRGSASSISAIAEVVVVRNWRRRYRPLTQPSIHDRPVIPGRPRPSQRLRHVNSAPSIQAIRRMSTSRSLVSSPLYSIPEEMHQQMMRNSGGSIDYDSDGDVEVVVGSVDRYLPNMDID